MTPEPAAPRLTRWRRQLLDRLLEECLDLEPDERARRVARLRQRYPRLSARLVRLLRAAEEDSELFQTSLGRVARVALDRFETEAEQLEPGARLGPWQIDCLAGQGGMGMVYRGHRADGRFEREVAIKLMRRRHPDFAERLASETRLLARLDHPAVARILDGGQTDDGRYYMVMDWVGGEDLDRVLRERAVDPTALLDLFEQIAEAVAHAHQRLIVHGDIKPGNVRVERDGRAVLLDFGIARLIEAEAGDDAPQAFTPAFAAPEQRAGHPATTQSDVWSLGALLAWMIRGGKQAAPETLEPSGLCFERAIDLVAIVRRATAAEPAQRYTGVPELLADLRRLRSNHPVAARSSGKIERLRLWSRRHRLAAVLGAVAALSLIAGLAAQTWQARMIAAERDVARFEADRSAMLREQLAVLFRDAAAASEPGEELSARDLLDASAVLADEILASDPAALASIKAMLGEIYIAMDDFTAAEPLLRSFVESDQAGLSPMLRALGYGDLAQVELRKGNFEEALRLVETALEMLETPAGDHNERRADLMAIRGQVLRGLGRWDEAIASLRQALDLARGQRERSRLIARTANNLGATLFYAERGTEALPVMEFALEHWRALGLEDGSDALTVMTNLASLLHQQGELDRAEPLYRELIERRERRFGASGALGAAYLNYASLLATRYRPDEAERSARRGMDLIVRFEGEDSINHARAQLVFGRVLTTVGDLDRAQGYLDRAVAMFERLLGEQHRFSKVARLHRARLAVEIEAELAREELLQVIAALEALQPGADSHLAVGLCDLARLEIARGAPAAGLEAAARCRSLRQRTLPPDSWMLAEVDALEAAAQLQLGQAAARQQLAAARDRLAQVLGAGHPDLRWCDRQLDPGMDDPDRG